MRTKVKILQHNRLDANSYVPVKLVKAKKIAPIFSQGPIKNLGRDLFRDRLHRKHGNFLRLTRFMGWLYICKSKYNNKTITKLKLACNVVLAIDD